MVAASRPGCSQLHHWLLRVVHLGLSALRDSTAYWLAECLHQALPAVSRAQERVDIVFMQRLTLPLSLLLPQHSPLVPPCLQASSMASHL